MVIWSGPLTCCGSVVLPSRVVGRIALLAYVLGGMVVTSFHRHGSCGPCAVVCVRGESQSNHSDQSDPSDCDHAHAPSGHSENSADSLGLSSPNSGFVGSPQDIGRCGEDCVACLFAGSGQSSACSVDWEIVDLLSQDRTGPPTSLFFAGAQHRPGVPRGPPSDASIVR